MDKLTTGQSFSLFAASSVNSAVSGYLKDRHTAKMSAISWNYDKSMAQANERLNQYLINKNRMALMSADSAQAIDIQRQEMEAKATALVAQSADGVMGGSAQQAIHAIARKAEQMQTAREGEYDTALFANKFEAMKNKLSTQTQIGIQPIAQGTGALQVGAGVADISAKYQDLYAPIKTG